MYQVYRFLAKCIKSLDSLQNVLSLQIPCKMYEVYRFPAKCGSFIVPLFFFLYYSYGFQGAEY